MTRFITRTLTALFASKPARPSLKATLAVGDLEGRLLCSSIAHHVRRRPVDHAPVIRYVVDIDDVASSRVRRTIEKRNILAGLYM